MFECTANVVEDLISSLDLELLAPNGMPLASVTSPDSNTLLYSLSSLDTSDGGEYKCRAVLVIPGSGVDSSTTATKFITVVGIVYTCKMSHGHYCVLPNVLSRLVTFE